MANTMSDAQNFDRGIGWCLTIEKGGRFRQVDVPERLEQRWKAGWQTNLLESE